MKKILNRWQATFFAVFSFLSLTTALVTVVFSAELSAKPGAVRSSTEHPVDSFTVSSVSVGKSAPGFELFDHAGKIHSLFDYRNTRNVLLVFYRGSWCPYCVSHLDDIQNLFPTLKKYGIQLLAISPDVAKKSARLAKRFNKPYIFLSDPDLRVAQSYGVQKNKALVHPAVVLIDKQGQVRWFHIDQEHRERPSGLALKKIILETLE